MNNETDTSIVVIAWYRADQYDAIRAFASDPIYLEKTFEQWKVIANKTVDLLISEGKRICKVDFDHATFMTWAAARNVQSTQQTRIAFCIELARFDKH